METTLGHSDKEVEHALIGGFSSEIVAGAAAVVLAILGLADVGSQYMTSVTTIALGAALILDGAAVAAEYSRILSGSGEGTLQKLELGGGLGTQIAGGIAAVVLGVLGLANLAPIALPAVAAIVLGATMIFSSGVTARLNAFKIETASEHEMAKRVARDALSATAGTDVLVGLAAIVLGILALVGFAPVTLTLVAMLALGIAVLLTGGAVIGKMLSLFGI